MGATATPESKSRIDGSIPLSVVTTNTEVYGVEGCTDVGNGRGRAGSPDVIEPIGLGR